MGIFARRRAATAAAAEHSWQDVQDQLEQELDLSRTWCGDAHADGVTLKAGETAFAVVDGSGLVESHREPSHFVAGNAGLSIPIEGRTRVRVGGTRGHVVPGPESDQTVDVGTAAVTSTRLLFLGGKVTREWPWEHVLASRTERLASGQLAVMVSIDGRPKVSGVSLGAPGLAAQHTEWAMALAEAVHRGDREAVVADVQAQLSQHAAARPASGS